MRRGMIGVEHNQCHRVLEYLRLSTCWSSQTVVMLHADWWHDHASGNHADGLAGLFIIDPEEGTQVAYLLRALVVHRCR
jgi:Multicopper oxidase